MNAANVQIHADNAFTWRCWRFGGPNECRRLGDDRPIRAMKGLRGGLLETDLPRCADTMRDALICGSGAVIYRVEISGERVDSKTDCHVYRRVKYLGGRKWLGDLLRRFARLCALDVVRFWAPPRCVMDHLNDGAEDRREVALAAIEEVLQPRRLGQAAMQAREYWAIMAAESAAGGRPHWRCQVLPPHTAAIKALKTAVLAVADAAGPDNRNLLWSGISVDALRRIQNERLTEMVAMAIREAEA